MSQDAFADAIRNYWNVRAAQAAKQAASGKMDAGLRGAVTGGGHLDGIAMLLEDLFIDLGFPPSMVRRKANIELPGYYRPTKEVGLGGSRPEAPGRSDRVQVAGWAIVWEQLQQPKRRGYRQRCRYLAVIPRGDVRGSPSMAGLLLPLGGGAKINGASSTREDAFSCRGGVRGHLLQRQIPHSMSAART